MEMTTEQQFIYQGKYCEKETILAMEQNDYFLTIKKGIEELRYDTKTFFNTIVKLIEFFKFPVLLLLKKPIQKIYQDQYLTLQFQKDIKKIAKITKSMLGQKGYVYQLEFLFKKGIDQTYCKEIKLSSTKTKYIEYIKLLSEEKHQLLEKLRDKTIKEEDLLKFQALNLGKEMKLMEQYFENYIKADIKEIQEKYVEMLKEKKKIAKKIQDEAEMKQVQSGQSSPEKAMIQPNIQSSSNGNQKQNLQDIPICCRRFFYHNQLIHQPQNIHFIHRYYSSPYDSKNMQQTLKNVCGLLNSQGGYIFLGIKQDKNTCKKQIQGYTLLQKQKQQIRNNIYQQVDQCILPNISHDMLKILFVPIKDKKTGEYLSGKFLIKVCVRFGERKQFYSYKEFVDSKRQFFAIRTDNQTKIITNGQQILNIYRQRLINTPPEPKPFHIGQCEKPEIGKPLYQRQQFGKTP